MRLNVIIIIKKICKLKFYLKFTLFFFNFFKNIPEIQIRIKNQQERLENAWACVTLRPLTRATGYKARAQIYS